MKGSVRKPRTDDGTSSYRLCAVLDDRGRRRQREVGGFRTKKDAQTASDEALADTVRWNLIVTNPAAATRVPKGEAKEMTVWTGEQARDFLDDLAHDRLVGLWTLALRRGELAGLRWSDIDLDAGTLTVAQQRTTANHAVVVTTPKAKSQRQLLLAPATIASLKAHLNRQRQERLALRPDWTDSGYVFVDEAGVEFHPHRFTKIFGDAINRAGAPRIRLQHTMASLALEAGVHPKVVQNCSVTRRSPSPRRQDRRPVQRLI